MLSRKIGMCFIVILLVNLWNFFWIKIMKIIILNYILLLT